MLGFFLSKGKIQLYNPTYTEYLFKRLTKILIFLASERVLVLLWMHSLHSLKQPDLLTPKQQSSSPHIPP